MKKYIFYIIAGFMGAFVLGSCSKDGNYPGGMVSSYIGIFDVRNIYKGQPVQINQDNLDGSTTIAGVVVSDHREGNFPDGYLVIQDRRRLRQLRGITIPLGKAAENYVIGDSLEINIVGSELTRENGILQLKNIAESNIVKIASDRPIPNNRVTAKDILANPDKYESTLVAIVKGGFNPLPAAGDILEGQKILNDGFGNLNLETKSSAKFAKRNLSVLANYFGVIFNKQDSEGKLIPYEVLRKESDIQELSSVIEHTSVAISGFASDVKGGDGNYEYVQLLAIEDIDFSKTPYAVIVSNNANASTPTGIPAKGWATGGMRTYKLNITSGTVTKGQYFYVGGKYKLINGSSSTDISNAKWVVNYDYVAKDGFDGIGTKTGGLMANSGNAFGIAVFNTTAVTEATKPVDVMYISGGGALTDGTRGYRITNNDFYDVIDPLSLKSQPFFMAGTNTIFLKYNTADVGYFVSLGGVYNTSLARWTSARSQNNIEMTKASTLSEIENELSTKIEQ
ncbi:hypothetical protein AAW12_08285 [Sphingobacterium sp. Ag1]|uniref:DUF5689 domain-containing protein n=1 Tax=Sphingobacterium sp. Ag1 TaxID=1643451 RepID=UPI00062791E5|nr:DUF5689 domain-containing protein [Sphingobacterium sp. Ag1]KKO91906.1 hypothetical protein AAW12_08285 [Sphingobacterium sp. Ag1]